MILDDFDPNDIRVVDQRDPEVKRKQKIANEFLERYLEAGFEYRDRNPEAPSTGVDHWILKKIEQKKAREAWDNWMEGLLTSSPRKSTGLARILFGQKR